MSLILKNVADFVVDVYDADRTRIVQGRKDKHSQLLSEARSFSLDSVTKKDGTVLPWDVWRISVEKPEPVEDSTDMRETSGITAPFQLEGGILVLTSGQSPVATAYIVVRDKLYVFNDYFSNERQIGRFVQEVRGKIIGTERHYDYARRQEPPTPIGTVALNQYVLIDLEQRRIQANRTATTASVIRPTEFRRFAENYKKLLLPLVEYLED